MIREIDGKMALVNYTKPTSNPFRNKGKFKDEYYKRNTLNIL
jgi:hypothetical protein